MGLFIFHHGGNFVHDKHMFYRGGCEIVVEGQYSNKWSFFEAVSLVKDWGYDGFRLWIKIPGLDKRFTHFIDDVQAEEIVNHSLSRNVDGHMWIEHGVEDMLSKVSKPDVDQFSEYSDDDIIDDDVEGVRFDDSEEEITCEREEGFVEVEVARPISGNRGEVNGKSLRFKGIGSKSPKKMKSPIKVRLFILASVLGSSSKRNTNNVESQDVDNDGEELESSDPDDSDNEKQPKHM